MLAASPRITDNRALFRRGWQMGSADQRQWLVFDPDVVKSMAIAFDEAVLSLELTDDADPFRYVVPRRSSKLLGRVSEIPLVFANAPYKICAARLLAEAASAHAEFAKARAGYDT